MLEKENHGGTRKGAGRKKMSSDMKKINMCGKVKPKTREWIKSRNEAAGVVIDDLVEFFKSNHKE